MITLAEKETIILEVKESLGTEAATMALLELFGLDHSNYAGILFRPPADKTSVVFTTEGHNYAPQYIRVPENLFDFPIVYLSHMFAHEFIHIGQRSGPNIIENKEEREFEAYYHGVFPNQFNLPTCPDWLKIQFCTALERYFGRMTEAQKVFFKDRYKQVSAVKAEIIKAKAQ